MTNTNNIIWKTKTFGEMTNEELYQILQVRSEVFVIEQNCNYQDLDNSDENALHLWAEENGKTIAYCRLFDVGVKYKETSIGRVLTVKSHRRRNLGRQMMKYAVQIIENRFSTPKIRISAQDYLIDFYQEFGFQSTEKKYLEDHLPHTEMFRC